MRVERDCKRVFDMVISKSSCSWCCRSTIEVVYVCQFSLVKREANVSADGAATQWMSFCYGVSCPHTNCLSVNVGSFCKVYCLLKCCLIMFC